MDSYEDGINRLVDEIRRLDAADWSSTALRKDIRAVEKLLINVVDVLERRGRALIEIEAEHDSIDGATYSSIVWQLRSLAESSRRAMGALPDSRERPAIPFAASAWVYLRYCHGYPLPKLSDQGPDVAELGRVCERAGLVRSPQVLRNALSTALKQFDPAMTPFAIRRIAGD